MSRGEKKEAGEGKPVGKKGWGCKNNEGRRERGKEHPVRAMSAGGVHLQERMGGRSRETVSRGRGSCRGDRSRMSGARRHRCM